MNEALALPPLPVASTLQLTPLVSSKKTLIENVAFRIPILANWRELSQVGNLFSTTMWTSGLSRVHIIHQTTLIGLDVAMMVLLKPNSTTSYVLSAANYFYKQARNKNYHIVGTPIALGLAYVYGISSITDSFIMGSSLIPIALCSAYSSNLNTIKYNSMKDLTSAVFMTYVITRILLLPSEQPSESSENSQNSSTAPLKELKQELLQEPLQEPIREPLRIEPIKAETEREETLPEKGEKTVTPPIPTVPLNATPVVLKDTVVNNPVEEIPPIYENSKPHMQMKSNTPWKGNPTQTLQLNPKVEAEKSWYQWLYDILKLTGAFYAFCNEGIKLMTSIVGLITLTLTCLGALVALLKNRKELIEIVNYVRGTPIKEQIQEKQQEPENKQEELVLLESTHGRPLKSNVCTFDDLRNRPIQQVTRGYILGGQNSSHKTPNKMVREVWNEKSKNYPQTQEPPTPQVNADPAASVQGEESTSTMTITLENPKKRPADEPAEGEPPTKVQVVELQRTA